MECQIGMNDYLPLCGTWCDEMAEENFEWSKSMARKIIRQGVGVGYGDEIEGVALEALVKAIKTFKPFPDNQNFRTYATMLIRNALMDHCRNFANTKQISIDPDDIPEIGVEDKAFEYVDERESSEDVIKVLSGILSLSRRKGNYKRVTLGLNAIIKEYDGYSREEIAEMYGISKKELRRAIYDARKLLTEA